MGTRLGKLHLLGAPFYYCSRSIGKCVSDFMLGFLHQVKSRKLAHDHRCMPNCSNRRDKCPNLSLHSIPANEGLRKRRLMAIKCDVDNTSKSSSTDACGAHFTATDFSTGSNMKWWDHIA